MSKIPHKRAAWIVPGELLRRSTRNKSSTSELPPTCDSADNLKHVAVKKEKPAKVKLEEETLDSGAPLNKRVKSEPTSPSETSTPSVSELKPDGYLLVDEEELDLERTLLGGQSFRWLKQNHSNSSHESSVFTGTVAQSVFQLWRCDNKRVAYSLLNVEAPSGPTGLLEDYFQLQYKLSDLYPLWSKKDANFERCCKHYGGFRILRQDPVENVFSFICATNNNIKRISLMISGLCRRFGLELTPKKTAKLDPAIQDRFFAFPTAERLAADDVFNVLRYELGFGYRAKFICDTASMLVSDSREFGDPRAYLMSLRQEPYKETCRRLQRFPGIGRKVADCICLMSMDHLCSVPIDCHIYEIVCRDYMKTLRQERKTLTEKVHDLIGELKHLKQETSESPRLARKPKKAKCISETKPAVD